MNSFILVGKIIEEPSNQETSSGKTFTKLVVKEKRSYKNANGEYGEDIYDVTIWSNNIGDQLNKDDVIAIKGRIQSYSYDNEDKSYHNVELIGEKVSVYHELV